jgi:SAM-dependent methyltransferase
MSGTSYDEIPYPSHQFRQTHPLKMALPAAFYGLPFAKPETARVLEIGCGEGGNLIAMAVGYPDARFVGFDLAATAIDIGRQTVETLGLNNIELLPLDILEVGAELGQFDYIIAHGVYSWVPDVVRDGVLRLIKACLSPEGLAFVSYNALPGCHLRVMIREMVLHHLRGVEGFEARINGAREFLKFMVDNAPGGDVTAADVKSFCASMLERPVNVLFHDELGEFYEPRYLHQFAAESAAHGLMLLGESEGSWWREEFFPTPIGQRVAGMTAGDLNEFHQYLDFLNTRTFRQSIITHAGRPIDRKMDYSRIRNLWVLGSVNCKTPNPDLTSRAEVDFEIDNSGVIAIDIPELKQAVYAIGQAWPSAMPVADLPDHPDVNEGLLQLFTGSRIGLVAGPAPAAAEAGERPVASPLARLQIARGAPVVCSLEHKIIAFEDEQSRTFMALLDGTRTREELAEAMADDGQDLAAVKELVDFQLKRLARLAMLVR